MSHHINPSQAMVTLILRAVRRGPWIFQRSSGRIRNELGECPISAAARHGGHYANVTAKDLNLRVDETGVAMGLSAEEIRMVRVASDTPPKLLTPVERNWRDFLTDQLCVQSQYPRDTSHG